VYILQQTSIIMHCIISDFKLLLKNVVKDAVMKNLILSNIYIILYTFLFTTSAIAGGEVSGGGTLLVCKSNGSYQVSLYDLKNNKKVALKLPVFKFTEDKNTELELEPLNIKSLEGFKFLQNLNNPVVNHILEFALNHARWLSTNADLAKLHDISNPESVAKNCKLYQLAIHYDGVIIFQRDLLKLLDQSPIQQAAAILHESLRSYSTSTYYRSALFSGTLSKAPDSLSSVEIEKIVFSLVSAKPLPSPFDVGFKIAMGFPFYGEEEAFKLSKMDGWPKFGDLFKALEEGLNSWFEQTSLQGQSKQKLGELIRSYAMVSWPIHPLYSYYSLNKITSSLVYYKEIKRREILDLIVYIFENRLLESDCGKKLDSYSQQEKVACILDSETNWSLKYTIHSLFHIRATRLLSSKYLFTEGLTEYDINKANAQKEEEQSLFIQRMKDNMQFMRITLMKVMTP